MRTRGFAKQSRCAIKPVNDRILLQQAHAQLNRVSSVRYPIDLMSGDNNTNANYFRGSWTLFYSLWQMAAPMASNQELRAKLKFLINSLRLAHYGGTIDVTDNLDSQRIKG
jgi:hypothetical protein